MLRRPRAEGRPSPQQQKFLLAFAFILLPWLPLADAQRQQPPHQPHQQNQQQPGTHPLSSQVGVRKYAEGADNGKRLVDNVVIPGWSQFRDDETDARTFDGVAPEASGERKKSSAASKRQQYEQVAERYEASTNERHAKKQQHRPPVGSSGYINIHNDDKNKLDSSYDKRHILDPDDASALATLAPAQAVRAPRSPRHLRPSSIPASGLSSQQHARSLEDWEVEDFVLLATVEGNLHATDRKTGRERWQLEVDQPMVETVHHRANSSVLDEDYSPVDHYIWAVEPTRDGGIYIWVPNGPDARPRATGFTMKSLVEELAPFADEQSAVVYTGDKKTTLITLDAATGRVIKWFGSGGSQVNEAESCLRPNALYDKDTEECSSTGTVTLGRTEYTVGIQRRDDGRQVATLKYAEWGPNNYDLDLLQQYRVSLDNRYIASQHDGKVYAFDYARAGNAVPIFSHKFAAPVARVFDVCRPWSASAESSPELIVLPQPAMPSQDASIAQVRSNSIFLNQTEGGSWYAMSGRAYPLIIDAPLAPVSTKQWWDVASAWDSLNGPSLSKALVGTHSLDTLRSGGLNAPGTPNMITDGRESRGQNTDEPLAPEPVTEEPTIVDKVKLLPQSAAESVVDFIKNPILFLIFFAALIYNEKKLRRSYGRWCSGSSLQDAFSYLMSDGPVEARSKPQAEGLEEIAPRLDAAEGAEDKDGATRQQSDQHLDADAAQARAGSDDKPNEMVEKENGTDVIDKADRGSGDSQPDATPKIKKARRGRRGGTKHRKGPKLREGSLSREDDAPPTTVEEAVKNAKRLGDRPSLEPDVMTVANDMQAVTGPIIRMGNIEVNTEVQLGTGSNGTLVFAGKFDGREVAVKRMLIQFYDIASQETRLLRESDDHPNGKFRRRDRVLGTKFRANI